MTNFFKALELLDDQPASLTEYRLYYDTETGNPRFYTMEDEDGEYIIVTCAEFALADMNVIVRHGAMTTVAPKVRTCKLVPSAEGFGTIENDVSIVGNKQYWSTKIYE